MEYFGACTAIFKMTQPPFKSTPSSSESSVKSKSSMRQDVPKRPGISDFTKLPQEQRDALAWTHTARFLTTASKVEQLPQTELPEIAFVGRSNAGKSTAINVLTQQGRLAFASKTPGRTQHINLFELGPKALPNALFADLPGYGYAAVARGAKLRWQQVMADYLAHRRSLGGVVLMVDARLGLTDLDRRLLQFIGPRLGSGQLRLLVLLTKADKLSSREAACSVATAHETLTDIATEESDVSLLLFSALKKMGVGDAALALQQWISQPRVEKDQTNLTTA